jgi:hypothetical protein
MTIPSRKPKNKIALPGTTPSPPSTAPRDLLPYAGKPYLPTDSAERKGIPLCTGFLDYFPLACIEVAKISKAGNDQHNPGEPLHWARGKSMDQADTIIRHIMERGGIDPLDGKRHTAKAAWRIFALLQIEMEEALGLPISRGSTP